MERKKTAVASIGEEVAMLFLIQATRHIPSLQSWLVRQWEKIKNFS
jgi:hypothetical protein